MTGTPSVSDLLDGRFRPNPAYELVLFDRLTLPEQEALSGLRQDSDFYGILRPLKSDLGVKSVCLDTALLLYTLYPPGPNRVMCGILFRVGAA